MPVLAGLQELKKTRVKASCSRWVGIRNQDNLLKRYIHTLSSQVPEPYPNNKTLSLLFFYPESLRWICGVSEAWLLKATAALLRQKEKSEAPWDWSYVWARQIACRVENIYWCPYGSAVFFPVRQMLTMRGRWFYFISHYYFTILHYWRKCLSKQSPLLLLMLSFNPKVKMFLVTHILANLKWPVLWYLDLWT